MTSSDENQKPMPDMEPEMAVYLRERASQGGVAAFPSAAGDSTRPGMSAKHQMPSREMNEPPGGAPAAQGETPTGGA